VATTQTERPRRRRGVVERGRLVAEVVRAYVRARRALAAEPIEAVVAELRAGSGEARQIDDPLEESRSLGWIVVRTMTFLPGDTRCLRRSLVLMQLMARRGICGRLVIGTRTSPDFLAHAWIEYEGEPVLSPLEGEFGRLVEL
jgi:hypothetical protein